MHAEIQALESALPTLPADKQEFARSLLAQYASRGDLSPKQWPWVRKLANPEAAPAREEGYGPIMDMLTTALGHMQRPRLRLATADGEPVAIKLNTRGKNEGCASITDGEPYGFNRYYGLINDRGVFSPGRDLSEGVRAFLVTLAADPVGVIAAYGHATGECSFCARELTDERSVTVGYGPICADHYGLPWG